MHWPIFSVYKHYNVTIINYGQNGICLNAQCPLLQSILGIAHVRSCSVKGQASLHPLQVCWKYDLLPLFPVGTTLAKLR